MTFSVSEGASPKIQFESPFKADLISDEAVKTIEKYNKAAEKGKISTKEFEKITKKSDDSLKSFLTKLNGASASTDAYSSSLVKSKVAAAGMQVATQGLTGLLQVGAELTVDLVSKGIMYLVTYSDRLIEKGNEAVAAAQEMKEQIKANEATVTDIGSTYATLAQGVGPYNKNLSLSNEQYEQFISLQNQLAQIFPDIVTGYDAQGNALVSLDGDVQTITASLNDMIQKQKEAADWENVENFSKAYTGKLESVEKLRKQKEKLERESAKSPGSEIAYTKQGLPVYIHRDTGEIEYIHEYNANNSLGINKLRSGLQQSGILYQESNKQDNYFNYLVFDYTLTPEQEAAIEKDLEDTTARITEKYAYETKKAKSEKQRIDNQIAQERASINPFLESFLNTDLYFGEMDQSMQNFVKDMVSNIDFFDSELGLTTAQDVQDYISNGILQPLAMATPEVKDKFSEIFSLQDLLADGDISIRTFADNTKELLNEILGNSDNIEFVNSFQDYMKGLGIEGENLTDIIANLVTVWAQWSHQEKPIFFDDVISAYQKTSNSIEAVIDSTSLMNAALAEQEKNGKLSYKTMNNLIQAGYAGALSFDENTGAVTVNKDAMLALAKAKLLVLKVDLTEQANDLTTLLQQENEKFESFKMEGNVAAAQRSQGTMSTYSSNKMAIEGSIGVVDNLINNFDKIASTGEGSRYSSSSGSTKDTWLEAYNKEKADLDHRRKMGVISEEDYLNELRALNDKYFKDKEKYQDKDWANQEEIRSLEQSLTKDKISDINDEISALEKEENTYDDQLDLVYQQRDAINDAIEDARAKGYDIESEYYKSLEKLMDENLEKEKSIIDAKREYEQKAFLEDIDASKERISSYKESGHGEISGELMVEEAEQAMKAINERIEELRGEDSEANKEYIKELQKQYKELDDSRLEGLQMILDAEKKQIDESISAAREALEKERKATEEYWNEEIKAYKRKHEAQEKVNTLKEKELQLENLKKQRNVLTYMEGQGFVYTADTEAVDAAQEDLDKTREEYEYQAQLQRMEDAKERALQAIDDELAKLDEQQEFWDQYFEDFELNSATAQSIHEDWVKNQGEQFVKQTDNIRIYSENYTKYLQDMIDKMRELNALEGNAKIKTELGGSSSSKERNSSKGYASGSAYVSNSGTYLVNENGPEAIFKPGLGTYEYLPQGTVVFSAAATKNLWNWSKLNPARTLSASHFPTVAAPQVNSISIGDVILNGVQDTDRLSREIVDRLPLAMQQEFYKR